MTFKLPPNEPEELKLKGKYFSVNNIATQVNANTTISAADNTTFINLFISPYLLSYTKSIRMPSGSTVPNPGRYSS
ncbi:MAG: hypothetical protein QXT44_00225 [Candidatus Bathyarchaeia archaeon]